MQSSLSGRGASLSACQDLGHLHHAALTRTLRAGLDDGQVARRPEAVGLGPAAAARATGEFLQLLADGVVLFGSNGTGRLFAALEMSEAGEEIVVGARLLAVDVHHVKLGSRGIGSRE